MMRQPDELLNGAIDVHCHGYPEISLANRSRLDDLEAARHAQGMGMRGLVLKSHTWPTQSRVYYLQQMLPDFKLFGSVTLNACCGGINPWVVEMAAKEGARVVWMPTWSARYFVSRGTLLRHIHDMVPSFSLSEADAMTVLDDRGRLLANVLEVLQVVKALGLPLFTGHLSPEESLALMEEGRRIGLPRLVFGHPHIMGATAEQIARFAELGGYVELCGLPTMPLLQRVHPRQLFETMRQVGAERCILSTDSFFGWSPPPAEAMRMYIGILLSLGATEEEIAVMTRHNPAKLLGLEPQ